MREKKIKILETMQWAYAKEAFKPVILKILSLINIKKEITERKELIIYFAGNRKQVKYFKEYIDTFNHLLKHFQTMILMRNLDSYFLCYRQFKGPVYYVPTLNDLILTYHTTNPKVILYINHDDKNFQSFIYEQAMHVYLHLSKQHQDIEYSHQVKNYDYIFVRGKYEKDNYLNTLLKASEDHFIITGKPQLDLAQPASIDAQGKKVILYAPLSGKAVQNVLSSSYKNLVEELIKNILECKQFFLIYKPPSNMGSYQKTIHKKIIQATRKHPFSKVLTHDNLYDIYPRVDLAIFDLPLDTIDFLYFDKPFLLTTTSTTTPSLIKKSLWENHLISSEGIKRLCQLINNAIENDPMDQSRRSLQKYYFGCDTMKGSVKKLQSTVSTLMSLRDKEMIDKTPKTSK